MSEEIIDLTKSDDEVPVGKPSDTGKAQSGTRRGSRRGKRRSKDEPQREPSEVVELTQPPSKPSRKSVRRDHSVPDKPMEDDKAIPEPAKPSGSSSLLSRIGAILHENAKENNKSGRSKRGSHDRPPQAKGQDRGRADEAPVVPTRSPKEIPLSELPVDQLFFIDTVPDEANRSVSAEALVLGTGSATPTPDPNVSGTTNTKAVAKKTAKERKRGRKQAEDKVPGDTINDVEFIGGSGLLTDDRTIAVTKPEGQAAVESAAVVTDLEAENQAVDKLSLPSHVTLWTEGDPELVLPSAADVLDLEDVEFLDYGDDQAIGIPRYFIPELAAGSKRVCRTCGEEGHIAKFCKRLICLTCGERDDHDTRNCPMRVVCFNCGGKGHLSSTCPQPRGRPGCDRCGSTKHIEQRCPEQFKTYVYLSEAERLRVLEERAALKDIAFGQGGEGYIARHKWCYNCGNGGHWGDDCKEKRPFSTPNEPCAFGSFNASRGPFGDYEDPYQRTRDEPRPAWMDDDPHLQDVGRRGKEATMRRNRAAEASRRDLEHDEDDWFSRTATGSSRKPRSSNDRDSGSRDILPPKPKFSFKPHDDHSGSNRHFSGDHDRNRERRRDNDRDYDRRKRARDHEDQGNRRRGHGSDSRTRDPRDRRDDDRRRKRSPPDRRGEGDRYRPQYRGSYA